MKGIKITALLLALSLVCASSVGAEEISRLNSSNRTLLESVYGVGARVKGVSNVSETPGPTIVVLANSIDYELAPDLFAFLENRGLEMVRATADDFEQYKNEKFLVILGGPEAPEGVGDIVRAVLVGSEQDLIREKGAKKMVVKTNVWAMGQRVTILAGPDRDHTKLAHQENREKVSSGVLV